MNPPKQKHFRNRSRLLVAVNEELWSGPRNPQHLNHVNEASNGRKNFTDDISDFLQVLEENERVVRVEVAADEELASRNSWEEDRLQLNNIRGDPSVRGVIDELKKGRFVDLRELKKEDAETSKKVEFMIAALGCSVVYWL